MELNEIDDILSSLGVPTSTSQNETPEIPEEPVDSDSSEESSTFSDEDISNILEENGYEVNITPERGNDYDEDSEEDNREDELEELANSLEEESAEEENNIPAATMRSAIYLDEGLEAQMRPASSDNTAPTTEASNIIPPNSPTLLINESTSRFSGAEWFNEIQKTRIILAGVGGIGSNVAFQLARMVPASITLYDDDNVEAVNMAGQLFSNNDIGKSKVSAITDMITSYTTMQNIYAIKDKFTEDKEAGPIMICGFDNMLARRTFFNSWQSELENKTDEEKARCLFLDGRLSMDTLQVFCIQGNDTYNIDRYRKEFLFRDSQADATICSMKQTTYLACMIGSLMVNMFTNFVANTLNPVIPYDLPFFTEYDAQNVIFKTEN